MWDKPSFLPKPKLSTPRRLARALHLPTQPRAQTPSRLPKPSRNYSRDPVFTEPADNTTNADSKYLDTDRPSRLNPSVPVTKTIPAPRRSNQPSQSSLQPTIERNLTQSFREAKLNINQSYQPQPAPISSSFTQIRTHPEDFDDDDSDLSDHMYSVPQPMSPTPATPPPYVFMSQYPSAAQHADNPSTPNRSTAPFDIYIDEDLITRTPAKDKNNEWLQAFGIDISLLTISDPQTDENQHPNITPTKQPCKKNRTMSNVYELYNNNDFDPIESDIQSPHHNHLPVPKSTRRATDIHHTLPIWPDAEQQARPPSRLVTPHRRPRRSSVRVSVRELDALSIPATKPSVTFAEPSPRPRARGSEVFLTPVRASKKQREHTGTPLVVSEVRRSMRLNTPSKNLVPRDSADERSNLLERNNHSYIPNPCLN